MTSENTNAVQDIARLISMMNDHWVAGETEPIGAFLHENMVIAAADGSFRAQGWDVCLKSIEDFLAAGAIHQFEADNPAIDAYGSTAVASYNFTIRYEIGGTEYAEQGTDVLVLNLGTDGWKIVWRMTNSHASSDD